MSGGSYNYAYKSVSAMAYRLEDSGNLHRVTFGKHLHLVAEAMHAVEWVESCAWGPGDEDKAIDACLTRSKVLAVERERLETIVSQLEKAIGSARRALQESDGPASAFVMQPMEEPLWSSESDSLPSARAITGFFKSLGWELKALGTKSDRWERRDDHAHIQMPKLAPLPGWTLLPKYELPKYEDERKMFLEKMTSMNYGEGLRGYDRCLADVFAFERKQVALEQQKSLDNLPAWREAPENRDEGFAKRVLQEQEPLWSSESDSLPSARAITGFFKSLGWEFKALGTRSDRWERRDNHANNQIAHAQMPKLAPGWTLSPQYRAAFLEKMAWMMSLGYEQCLADVFAFERKQVALEQQNRLDNLPVWKEAPEGVDEDPLI